ncbi:MAG: hypothetical protein HQL73_10120 [Magnetococcales bacterium]|nr:hypothetical protein [Magnetococcales bacterium]
MMRFSWIQISAGVFSLLLVIFIFIPAFGVNYGVHSDHFNLVDKLQATPLPDGSTWFLKGNQLLSSSDYRQCCHYFIETFWLQTIGRSLNAWIVNWYFLLYQHIQDYSVGRLVSALMLGLTGWIFFRQLVQSLFLSIPMAATVSIGVFLLPPALLYVTWISNTVPGLIPVFFAIFCYPLIDKINFYDLMACNRRLYYFGISSILVYLTLCFIYPPNALLVAIYPLLRLLNVKRTGWKIVRFPIIRDIVFCGLVSMIFFIIVKYVVKPIQGFLLSPYIFYVTDDPNQKYSFLLSASPLDVANKFFESIKFGVNIWFPPQTATHFIVFALVIGAVTHYILQKERQYWKIDVIRIILGFIVLVLAFAPVIIGRNAFLVGYRNGFVIMASVVILVIWAGSYSGGILLEMLHSGRPVWMFQRFSRFGQALSGLTRNKRRISRIGYGVLAFLPIWMAHKHVATTVNYFGRIEQPYLERWLPNKTDAYVKTIILEHKHPHAIMPPGKQLCFLDGSHVRQCLLPEEFSTLNSLVNHDHHLAMMVNNLLRERDYGRDVLVKINVVSQYSTNRPGGSTWHVPLPTLTDIPEGKLLTFPEGTH